MNEKVNEVVKQFYNEDKIVAAICAGPITFGKLRNCKLVKMLLVILALKMS